MTKELKPCPFCGGEAAEDDNAQVYFDRDTLAEVDYDEPDGFWIECEECGAMTGEFETRQEAIEHWNTRVLEITQSDEMIMFYKSEDDKLRLGRPRITSFINEVMDQCRDLYELEWFEEKIRDRVMRRKEEFHKTFPKIGEEYYVGDREVIVINTWEYFQLVRVEDLMTREQHNVDRCVLTSSPTSLERNED